MLLLTILAGRAAQQDRYEETVGVSAKAKDLFTKAQGLEAGLKRRGGHQGLPGGHPPGAELYRGLHRTNKFEIARELVQLFHEFCLAIEREQSEGKMEACETIQISLLRTSLAEGQMVYELKVYDRNTQENSGLSPYLYHAEWNFSFLEAWMQACEDKRRAIWVK